MAAFEVTLRGRVWVTPDDILKAEDPGNALAFIGNQQSAFSNQPHNFGFGRTAGWS
jgi:hypothetical protein